jgi:hypothetical protein
MCQMKARTRFADVIFRLDQSKELTDDVIRCMTSLINLG